MATEYEVNAIDADNIKAHAAERGVKQKETRRWKGG